MAIMLLCDRCGETIRGTQGAASIEDATEKAGIVGAVFANWCSPLLFCGSCVAILGNDEATEEFFSGPFASPEEEA